MKTLFVLSILSLSLAQEIQGQVRVIQGRVISEDLEPLPQVSIQSADEVSLGKTDSVGRFTINVPNLTNELLFNFLGFESVSALINDNCDTVEVVMLYSGSYDFMSPRRVDKHRLARCKKLPDLFSQAYANGIFTKASICYTRKFEPLWPDLYKVKKEKTKN
jgi:hypothetical protein